MKAQKIGELKPGSFFRFKYQKTVYMVLPESPMANPETLTMYMDSGFVVDSIWNSTPVIQVTDAD